MATGQFLRMGRVACGSVLEPVGYLNRLLTPRTTAQIAHDPARNIGSDATRAGWIKIEPQSVGAELERLLGICQIGNAANFDLNHVVQINRAEQ